MEYVKSPLDYTGNKYRILSQIQPHFPTDANLIITYKNKIILNQKGSLVIY